MGRAKKLNFYSVARVIVFKFWEDRSNRKVIVEKILNLQTKKRTTPIPIRQLGKKYWVNHSVGRVTFSNTSTMCTTINYMCKHFIKFQWLGLKNVLNCIDAKCMKTWLHRCYMLNHNNCIYMYLFYAGYQE